MSRERVNFNKSVSVNLPLIPKTKEQVKEKNKKLRDELDKLRRQYREVYKVIQNLKKGYEETKMDLTPSYNKLKDMIKEATSEEVLERCRPPEHKHSVQNKGIDKAFSHSTSGAVNLHLDDSMWSKFDERKGTKGFLQSCREFSGTTEDPFKTDRRRDISTMHKAEIEAENAEIKHHLHCYDSKFLRAQNRLTKLKQEYEESKQYLPMQRYGHLKEMIRTVVEDTRLHPD